MAVPRFIVVQLHALFRNYSLNGMSNMTVVLSERYRNIIEISTTLYKVYAQKSGGSALSGMYIRYEPSNPSNGSGTEYIWFP